MIQLFKDDILSYDSRYQADDMRLLSMTGEIGLNKAGMLSFTMDANHKHYSAFIGYKTLVEVWKDDRLEFRGRALNVQDNFRRDRTVTCEGERGFLRDAIMRPYLYQDAPSVIFNSLIGIYNEQVESPKRFIVGEVTVTDSNDYVRLESTTAEQVNDTINKLIDRCGGVITFTTNGNGERVINWYDEVNYSTNQSIEFGENLLDYATVDESDPITAVLPYGAELEETEDKERITIKSVNDGVDYVADADAVALRGFICRPIYFDDITSPANLKTAALAYLAENKVVITSLTLSAVDLSNLNKDINGFKEGDLIRVISKPHNVDGYYLLTERRPDFLNPAKDRITLGKSTTSLTGASASSYHRSESELNKITTNVINNAKRNEALVEETETMLLSLIEQTSESIMLAVSESQTVNERTLSEITTSLEVLSNQVVLNFEQLRTVVDSNGEQIALQQQYIRFENGDIILGEVGNELTLNISNDRISFLHSGAEVAYFTNNRLYVTDGEFTNSLRLGNFAFIPRENGNLSFRKVR